MSLFIGKWDTANRFLTVEQHLIDTASAMRYLLKRNVTEQTVNASNLSRKEFEKLAIYWALLYLGWVSSAENLTYPLSYRLRTPPLREPQMDAVGNRPTARNSGTDL